MFQAPGAPFRRALFDRVMRLRFRVMRIRLHVMRPSFERGEVHHAGIRGARLGSLGVRYRVQCGEGRSVNRWCGRGWRCPRGYCGGHDHRRRGPRRRRG